MSEKTVDFKSVVLPKIKNFHPMTIADQITDDNTGLPYEVIEEMARKYGPLFPQSKELDDETK